MLRNLSAIAFMLLFVSCDWIVSDSSEKDGPGRLPDDVLSAVEDTVLVEGKQLFLDTYLNRDFMPVAPPDGQDMYVVVRFVLADSGALPADLHADAVWVIDSLRQWDAWLKQEDPQRREWIARDGPKWEPGLAVDVVVRFFDAAQTRYYLIARNQVIERTD